MVQQYRSPVRVYKYPFALVMMAYERRFPTCPQIPVFVGCEVIMDQESQDRAIRTTERKCKLNVDAPYILKKIIGVDYIYFIQKNVLDRRNNVLEIEAYNESFSTRVTVLEKCRYFIHPENSDWTCFEQTASLDIKNFFGFENSMEKLAMKQYAQNISKGREIIEFFVDQLKEEGVEHVESWKDPLEHINVMEQMHKHQLLSHLNFNYIPRVELKNFTSNVDHRFAQCLHSFIYLFPERGWSFYDM